MEKHKRRGMFLSLVLSLMLLAFLVPCQSYGATTGFSASGVTTPGTLKQGASFVVKGRITSKNPLSKVEVGAVSATTGKWVNGCYHTAYPYTKTYNLAKSDYYLKFGILPKGSYYYRIWVHDNKGGKKRVWNQSFTVNATGKAAATTTAKASGSKTANPFTVTGLSKPKTLAKGKGFALKGTIRSTYPLKKVEVGVVNKKTGKWVTGCYKSTNTAAKSFNVASVDSVIKFGKLPIGDYYYRIWAHDNKGNVKRLVNHAFSVTKTGKAPASTATSTKSTSTATATATTTSATTPNFTLKNVNKPTTLTKGSAYYLKGTVSAKNTIKRIEVGVVGSGKWMANCYYNNTKVNAKTFNLAVADPTILFTKLPAGTYYYRIWVHDNKGNVERVLNSKFTVKNKVTTAAATTAVKPAQQEQQEQPSGGATATVTGKTTKAAGLTLSYNADVINRIGAQPYSGPCGVYAMAYVRTIIDGTYSKGSYKTFHDKIIATYSLGDRSGYAYWNTGGARENKYYLSQKQAYQAVLDELGQGRPCIIGVYNGNTGNNHYVCAIGYVKGTTYDNVTLQSFVVLDPATGTKRNISGTAYRSYSYPQIITFR